jgi:C-terminal processing protease CtpA/Prc
VANKLKGASGSTVALSLGRRGLFGKETLTVTLKRASIQQPAAQQPAWVAATAKAAAAPARPQTSPRPLSHGTVAPAATSPFLPGLFGAGMTEKKPEQRKPAGGPAEKKTGQSPPAQQKPEQGASDPFGGMISFFGNVQSEMRAMSGQSSGSVGLACAAAKGGEIIITGLQPGGAAERSGKVNVHDILLEVDAKPCPATVEKASDMLRGPAGSTVALKLKRRGIFGEALHIINVTLTRTEDWAKKEAAAREAKQKEEAAKMAKAAAEAKVKAEAAAKKVEEHVLKMVIFPG